MLYFDMVRMFGNIPLLLHETEPLTPPIATADDIYAQIISDLTDAEGLPLNYPGQWPGRAKRRSKALLAKFILQEVIMKTAPQNAKK